MIYQREFFADGSGRPLENGKIYVGEVNKDPETFPIDCFWDADLSTPATQPITVSAGYIVNAGSRADVYFAERGYSIRIRDKNSALVDYIPAAANDTVFTNVKGFGAVGDGVTDDTAAIQAAIDVTTTGQVYFPAGTYLISDTLDITKNGIALVGAGSGGTEIHMTADAPAIEMAGTSGNVINRTAVRNMTVRGGGKASTSAHGIVYKFANSCYIEDVVLFSCRHALHFEHNFQTAVNDIRVFGAGSDQSYIGVYMAETDLTYIDNAINANNVNVQSVSGYGFRIINGQGSKFVNCEAGGSPMINGWYIGDPTTGTVACQWMHFANCLGDSTVGPTWLLRQGTATALSQMQFTNCWAGNGDYGFYVDGATRITFTAPLVVGHAKAGIYFLNSANNVLTSGVFNANNEDNGAGNADIQIVASINNTIIGNNCESAGAGKSLIESGASNGNTITDNYLAQGATIIGANTVLSRNPGFRSEITGTATVLAANTSVTFNHGLGLTPPVSSISVTPLASLGSAAKFWVSDPPSSTQITINVNTAPGSDVKFAWQAILTTNW